MKLTFINVGYGECILAECSLPDQKSFVMLIDGGSAEAEEYADRSGGRIPLTEYLLKNGPDHIDLLVSTHTHEDHICAALQAARLYPPGQLWQSLTPEFFRRTAPLDVTLSPNPSRRKFLSALNDYGSLCRLVTDGGGEICQVKAGEHYEPCPGLRIAVLAPSALDEAELERKLDELYAEQDAETVLEKLTVLDGQMNNYSLMLRLDWQGTRILLPGDTNRDGYAAVDWQALPAHIFKVGHHGQQDGASPELLEAIRPEAVVCCASSDRRYNSAEPGLLNMIREHGAALYFSDCPPVPGMTVPTHHALTFQIGEKGTFTASYL